MIFLTKHQSAHPPEYTEPTPRYQHAKYRSYQSEDSHSFSAAAAYTFQSAIENREKEETRNRPTLFVRVYSNVSFSSRLSLPFLYLCLTPERSRVLLRVWAGPVSAFCLHSLGKWITSDRVGRGRLCSVHFPYELGALYGLYLFS